MAWVAFIVVDLGFRNFEKIPVDNDKVRPFARLEAAEPIFLMCGVGSGQSKRMQSLFAIQLFAAVPAAFRQSGPALPRDGWYGAGRSNHRLVATGVIAVLVCVEDLCNRPALALRRRQAFCIVQRIYRQCFTGLRASNQVIEISVCIASPDLFNDHNRAPQYSQSALDGSSQRS